MSDGGSAFPNYAEEVVPMLGRPDVTRIIGTSGMSMRDWFAGMAIQGLLAARACTKESVPGSIKTTEWDMGSASRTAFKIADLMIEERQKPDVP